MPLPCPGGCTGVPMKNILERRYKEMKKRVSALLLVLVLALATFSAAIWSYYYSSTTSDLQRRAESTAGGFAMPMA